jgi:hypothetical protein
MMKKAFSIVFILALFAGCSNKLNLLAPYKEIVSVYGLLDPSDTTHYIRIERVFSGQGNAYTFAQNPDSIYFKSGDLKVTLQRWQNGSQISVDVPATNVMEIVLTDTVLQSATGTFNQNERVYKTNHPLYSNDSTCVYKLIIHDNKTGKEFTAQTGLIGSFQFVPATNGAFNYLENNYPSTYQMNFIPGNNGVVTCIYNSPVNSGVCSLTIRLVYTENNGGQGTSKYTDISLGTYYTQQALGGETQDFSYIGNSLLSTIAASVPVPTSPSITRTLNYVQFILSAGGKDVALYNQVNTSTSLSQSKPNYSNIQGGVGVFSCRHQIVLNRNVSNTAIDTLSKNSYTCKLRFLNENGVLSPCN